MPSDLVQRVNLDFLYPPFLSRLLEVLADARALGQDYFVISGYRNHKEQDALYAQGRSTPGKKVTNARGGFSAHNWGIAVDVVADVSQRRGLQPSWEKAFYNKLKQAASPHDLQVGVPGLQDDGHIQLPLTSVLQRREVDIFKDFNALYSSGGMPAVWAQLDAWGFANGSRLVAVASGIPPSAAPKG